MPEPYRIAPYWESIKASAGDIKRPIYMWDCFSLAKVSISDLECYVDEIADALNSYGVRDELDFFIARDSEYLTYGAKIYAILYLVRCALISRLASDFKLAYRPEFNLPLGLDRVNSWYWGGLIAAAERGLGRNPLNNDNDFKRYCARIVFEGGLPLRSLQGDISEVAIGLKNIYRLRDNDLSTCERVLKYFIDNAGLLKPDNPKIWLPGGSSGARVFYDLSMRLFNYIETERKKNNGEVDEIEILKRLGFDEPSERIVKFIFKQEKTAKDFSSLMAPVQTAVKPVIPQTAMPLVSAYKSVQTTEMPSRIDYIKPIDWAREHGLNGDYVMKLLRDAGVRVLTVVSKVNAVEYKRIEAKVEELRRQAELRKTGLIKSTNANSFSKTTNVSTPSNIVSTSVSSNNQFRLKVKLIRTKKSNQ